MFLLFLILQGISLISVVVSPGGLNWKNNQMIKFKGEMSKSNEIQNQEIVTIKDPEIREKLQKSKFIVINDILGTKLYNDSKCITFGDNNLFLAPCYHLNEFQSVFQHFNINKENQRESMDFENRPDDIKHSNMKMENNIYISHGDNDRKDKFYHQTENKKISEDKYRDNYTDEVFDRQKNLENNRATNNRNYDKYEKNSNFEGNHSNKLGEDRDKLDEFGNKQRRTYNLHNNRSSELDEDRFDELNSKRERSNRLNDNFDRFDDGIINRDLDDEQNRTVNLDDNYDRRKRSHNPGYNLYSNNKQGRMNEINNDLDNKGNDMYGNNKSRGRKSKENVATRYEQKTDSDEDLFLNSKNLNYEQQFGEYVRNK